MRIENAWMNSSAHVAMLDEVNLYGYGTWKQILRAVEELQGVAPKSGKVVHRVAVAPCSGGF